ncbi:hypothetical protein CVIRNUC_004030 [Coccomyxa viridis]|uniref:F-box domain-containing protein n=1 Tax=Coccomyxa viridis TaxID=1274662 RepID=A0AAV1I396_9CHLO|nr:hypothetical protein CVIRNUC_004030 [Coccomyxa viridis]
MLLSSDDSENEFDDPQLVLTRYKKARYEAALSCPHNYLRACQELIELFNIVAGPAAGRVKKPLLAELSADTRLAIDCCDGVLRNATICRSLVSEAVRALPQAKGKELQRLLKARSLKAAREDSKAIRNSQQHDVAPAVEQMPHDILGAVLDELDPFSLAAAACASRQWHEEASKDHRWQPFVAAVLSPVSTPQQPQSWRELFCQAAVGGHARMAYHRSRRRMLRKTLLWTDLPPCREAPDFKCVTPRQVATFIVKGSIKELSDSEDSEGDDDASAVSGLHRDMAPAVNRLWRTFPASCKLALPETALDTGQQ